VNRPLYGLMDAPFFGDLEPPTFALEEFLNNLAWRYRKAHAGIGEEWEKEQAPLGIAEYGRLADDLHASVPEVYAAILPGRSSGMGGPQNDPAHEWFDRLRETFAANDTVTLYPHGLFAGTGTVDEIYYDRMHLNPKGHEVYAAYLAAQIEKSPAFAAWMGKSRSPHAPSARGETDKP
jgi:hypothetical protein